MNRLQYPSKDGENTTLGGYEIESVADLNPVRIIQVSGTIAMTAYMETSRAAIHLVVFDGSTTECAVLILVFIFSDSSHNLGL